MLGSDFDLPKVIAHLSFCLCRQGPVKDFIHQQPLHEFAHYPFEDAVWQASRLYGAFAYLPASFFQQAYREGRLLKRELERVFALRGTHSALRELCIGRLENPVDEPLVQPPRGIAREGIRARWAEVHGLELDTLVEPLLFRLLGGYLDQGIASRRFPSCTSFFEGVGNLVQNSFLPVRPLSDAPIRRLFQEPRDKVILHCLDKLVGDSALYERYLHEMMLAKGGWYAMANMIARDPQSLMSPKNIDVEQVLALELMIELGWMVRKQGDGFTPLAKAVPSLPPQTPDPHVDPCLAIWHEAYEWTHYTDALKALQTQSADRRFSQGHPSAQAYFCIDDRECSLRRYLEQQDPTVQTFSTAGHYSIDFMFQGAHDTKPVKQCPLPVTPKFVVRDVLAEGTSAKKPRVSHAFHLNTRANTLVRGWLTTQVIGFWSAIKLVLSIARPGLSQPTLSALNRIDPDNQLTLYRKGDEKTPEGLWLGYAVSEMADRVEAVLRSTGLTKDFAKIIVLFGHGSSSTNNPHFAAYDCGACSGRAGAPNSRVFAMMANDRAVRALLAERGIAISETTRFIGGIHDTTRDEVRYFDTVGLTPEQSAAFEQFKQNMGRALEFNAKERCRRFELVPTDLTPAQALAEVKKRSAALFEPRPEMNHATNTMAITARRSLTRDLFLDRRAFLQSYNPIRDPDGKILQGLLGALIPVCGGINLEYYFSRLDNEAFGAGTKLPHNIMSLLGVANGVEGDVRTGLPSQMVEIQDPIRLMLLIEQEPEVALAALERDASLYEWVANYWVRYMTISPTTHQVFCFNDGKMVLVDLSNVPATPIVADAQTLLSNGSRDAIPVHRFGGRK
jgi:uncharacterized protein